MSDQLAKELFDYFIERFQIYRLTDFITFSIPESPAKANLNDNFPNDYRDNEYVLQQLIDFSEFRPNQALRTLLASATAYLTTASEIPMRFVQRVGDLYNSKISAVKGELTRPDSVNVNIFQMLPLKAMSQVVSALTFAYEAQEMEDDVFINRFENFLDALQ